MAIGDGHPQRRTLRARALAAGAAIALVAPLAACGSDEGGGIPVLNLYQFPVENMQNVIDRCNQQADGKYEIVYQVLPRTADDQRVQMVRRLAAKDDSMDILGMDVTWTQEFASADWIREFTGADKAEIENGTLPGPLASAQYEGKLYAAPNNTNVQLLWYRKDLVPNPPKTWDEMIQMSRQLQADGKTFEVLTMGAQYEGLVVLFNSLVASAGGHVVSDDGKTAVMDAGAVKALQTSTRPCRATRRSWPRTSPGRATRASTRTGRASPRSAAPTWRSVPTAGTRPRPSTRCGACATRRARSIWRSTRVSRRPSRRCTTTRRWRRRTR